jgi:hypothetical protein
MAAADWIAVVRVARIEVDPTPGDPSFHFADQHDVAVFEALDVLKGPQETEVRLDLPPFEGRRYTEGDVVMVFLARGDDWERRRSEASSQARERLLQAGIDPDEIGELLDERDADEDPTAARFAEWARGRWLLSHERPLPADEHERERLSKLVRSAARLQEAGAVSREDRVEWLISVVEQPDLRGEELSSLAAEESSLTEAQLGRLAAAFADSPAVDWSDIQMLRLLNRYPGSEVDLAAASVIEAALRMNPIPDWATPMVMEALRRHGDDLMERVGRDDRDPSGRLIYMDGATETLPTLWAVARRELGIPEVPPAGRD